MYHSLNGVPIACKEACNPSPSIGWRNLSSVPRADPPLSHSQFAAAAGGFPIVATHSGFGSMALTSSSSDLELCVLQAFGAYAGESLVQGYAALKRYSRLARLLADTSELLLTKAGVAALVGVLFAQFRKHGQPWLQAVDEAMGKRIIDGVVQLLFVAARKTDEQEDGDDMEAGKARKLSFEQRVQALLRGEIPLQLLIEQTPPSPQGRPAIVMDLKDFVPADEVRRIKDSANEQLREMNDETHTLRQQLAQVERERQRLEQDLTDVHNYQASERGRRFQDMEVRIAFPFL